MTFDALRRSGVGVAVFLAAGLTAGASLAGISGFLGSWANPDSEASSFLGSWMGSNSDTSDIARIVVTPAGPSHARIHLYGRCKPALCDWGIQTGHNHSGAPGSDDIQSISADFNTGFAQKRLTLRQGPGGSLRFDVVTDFTDNSGRHDFETSGKLTLIPPAATASAPAAAEPGPMAAMVSGAVTAAAPVTAPAVIAGGGLTEDCVAINPEDVYVAPVNRAWQINDFEHTILKFGSNKRAALMAERVLNYYHIDEQCFVARPNAKMIYWRTAGQVPRSAMPGQDCADVHPAKVRADHKGGAWKVLDGDNALLDYGDDRAGAEMAASVIRTYRLSRQCFVARPDTAMQYWLTQ